MAIRFTGDFKALDKWIDRLERCESKEILETVAGNLADETIYLIQEGFEKSRDPYLKRWKKLAFRSGRPLDDTGGLKSSWSRRRVDTKGFSVASAKKTALWHQRGTGIYGPSGKPITPHGKRRALKVTPRGGSPMFFSSVKGTPPRRMIPEKRLPKRWAKRFEEAANDIFTEHFR